METKPTLAPIRSAAGTTNNVKLPAGDTLFCQHYQQRQRLLQFFDTHTSTMYQAEQSTGVCRPNICRIASELERQGRLYRVGRGLCPISGYRAWFFSTQKGGQL